MKIRYFLLCLFVTIIGIIYVNNRMELRWVELKNINKNALEKMVKEAEKGEEYKNTLLNNEIKEIKELSLKSKAACVYDCLGQRELFSKNSRSKLPMASTTKIMTCIVALENCDVNEECEISAYAASMPDVQLNAVKGEKYVLKDLLYSLMLESHNDVAVAIAEHIGKKKLIDNEEISKNNATKISIEEDLNNIEQSKRYVANFANLMNKKARELGLKNTNFVTPNGLDADSHYTTAYDLAVIASYAINNKDFLNITNTPSYTFKSDKGRSFTVNNKNLFLNSYSGAIGCKTGYTSKAGYCFVGAIDKKNTKGNYKLVSVVLGCGWPPHKTYKWQDTKKLMDYGVNNYSNKEIFIDNSIFNGKKVLIEKGVDCETGVECSCIKPFVNKKYNVLLKDNENISYEVKLNKKIIAPVKKGQVIGYIKLYIDNHEFKTILIKTKKSIRRLTYQNKFTELLHFFTRVKVDIKNK